MNPTNPTIEPASNALTIAVLGANGRLGSAVSINAAARGHRVLAVTRTGTSSPRLPGAIKTRAADALDANALARVVEGVDIVVNALNPVYTDWQKKAVPLARSVLHACKANEAHHLFAGNVYALGQGMPSHILPDAPDRPTSRKGAIRAQMEALFRDAAEIGSVPTTVLRAGDFFGGSVPGSWFDLVVAQKIEKGIITYPGPRNVPHAWAYLPDLASAFVDLAERHVDLPNWSVFGFEGHTLTGDELHAALERVVGRTLKRRGMPWTMIRLMGLVAPMMREVAEMAYLWRVQHSIDGKALEAIIGSPKRTEIDTALRESLAAME